jgi:hypothetical protein
MINVKNMVVMTLGDGMTSIRINGEDILTLDGKLTWAPAWPWAANLDRRPLSTYSFGPGDRLTLTQQAKILDEVINDPR